MEIFWLRQFADNEVDKLAYGRDRLAIRHDAPGVAKEEATSMEKARSKA